MDKDFSERFKIVFTQYCAKEIADNKRPSESSLARFIGVAQTTVQRWKNSQVPGPESLKAIHDKLGFAYDWLIAGEGEIYDTTAERLAELEQEVERLKALVGSEAKPCDEDTAIGEAVGQG